MGLLKEWWKEYKKELGIKPTSEIKQKKERRKNKGLIITNGKSKLEVIFLNENKTKGENFEWEEIKHCKAQKWLKFVVKYCFDILKDKNNIEPNNNYSTRFSIKGIQYKVDIFVYAIDLSDGSLETETHVYKKKK